MELGNKLPYRQNKSGFCAVYAYANTFIRDSFDKYFTEEAMNGANYFDEERMLKKVVGDEFGLAQVIYMNTAYRQGIIQDQWERVMVGDPTGENDEITSYPIIPMFATVRMQGGGKLHRIGILKDKRDPYTLYVIDSYTNDRVMIFKNPLELWNIYGAWYAITRITQRHHEKNKETTSSFISLAEGFLMQHVEPQEENRGEGQEE